MVARCCSRIMQMRRCEDAQEFGSNGIGRKHDKRNPEAYVMIEIKIRCNEDKWYIS